MYIYGGFGSPVFCAMAILFSGFAGIRRQIRTRLWAVLYKESISEKLSVHIPYCCHKKIE